MITPLDIDNKKFAKQMVNGYNVEEVDDFLDELTIDYSKNYKEVTELRAKVEELNNSLVQYKTIESTLQNTLVMAQSTAEEVKNVAKQKADQIVEEAKANAQKQVDELNNEIIQKQKELDDVKKQFDIYKAKMESLLISQLELIKDINKED
ncbi:MAG: DivIVA domain-containing protein [Clostridia bacterium]|jgi:cell division initiation protein